MSPKSKSPTRLPIIVCPMRIAVMLVSIGAMLSCVTASAVTIDLVNVANPGNEPDQDFLGDGNRLGAVSYAYRIGKYEVTNAQYAEFLNAVDPSGANPLGLFHDPETWLLNPGLSAEDRQLLIESNQAILLNTSNPEGGRYVVKQGRDSNPVVGVNWYDGMRFTNWLHNGQAGPDTTEFGAYTLLGGTPLPSNADDISRNPDAGWYLPNLDEWHKAAFHQPASAGGDIDDYWQYATRQNGNEGIPYSASPPGNSAPDPSNTVNFFRDNHSADGFNGGYAVTDDDDFDPAQNYLTDVGAFTQSPSYYGTFDQAGNVAEWLEMLPGSGIIRGGSFKNDRLSMVSDQVSDLPWSNVYVNEAIGFRVAAAVPEPGSGTLCMVAAATLAFMERRLRKA